MAFAARVGGQVRRNVRKLRLSGPELIAIHRCLLSETVNHAAPLTPSNLWVPALRRHVRDWLLAYNYAKQPKALRFKTPFEAIRQLSAQKPELFSRQPNHDMLGLNT